MHPKFIYMAEAVCIRRMDHAGGKCYVWGFPGSNFDRDGELWHRNRQIWSTKAPTKAQALLIFTARYISVARFALLSLFLLS